MTSEFEFQYPWVLTLLALLPVYAFLRGKTGRLSALLFSSADIARAAGAQARSAAGRLLVFLRLLAVAFAIIALAGPRLADARVETETAGLDIMLALDLSWSMMALDMGAPSERIFAAFSGKCSRRSRKILSWPLSPRSQGTKLRSRSSSTNPSHLSAGSTR